MGIGDYADRPGDRRRQWPDMALPRNDWAMAGSATTLAESVPGSGNSGRVAAATKAPEPKVGTIIPNKRRILYYACRPTAAAVRHRDTVLPFYADLPSHDGVGFGGDHGWVSLISMRRLRA